MKDSVNFYDFCDRFRSHGREDSFSYEGKKALFEYLEQYEDDCGIEIELDVVAIDCEYCEYENAIEVCEEYDGPTEDEEESLEWLHVRTSVIPFSGGIIIQSF